MQQVSSIPVSIVYLLFLFFSTDVYIRLFSSPADDGLGKVVYVHHIGFVKVGIIYRTEIWISGNATSVKYTSFNSIFVIFIFFY